MVKRPPQDDGDQGPPPKRSRIAAPTLVQDHVPENKKRPLQDGGDRGPPSKRSRTTVTNAAPASLQEQLNVINAQISGLERDIAAHAAEYQKVRTSMMSGIFSYEGVVARDRIDELTTQLDALRKQREAAVIRMDDAILSAMHERRVKDGINEDKIKKEKNDDEEGRHVCKGQCKRFLYDPSAYVDICEDCGAVYDHTLDSTGEFFAYGDMHRDVVPRRRGGGYKPPNHFAEILAQFQGKRRSCAPDHIVSMVSDYCKRYKIPPHKITPPVVRQILKQKQQEEAAIFKWAKKKPEKYIKYTDYYKHTPEIAWRLSGIPPPYMMPSQQDKLIALFPLAVVAYRTSPRYLTRKANRSGRKKDEPNVLNYFYMLYKLCQMAGYDEFLMYIPLPKSLANIEDCDQNGWKAVCAANHWQYIPTK